MFVIAVFASAAFSYELRRRRRRRCCCCSFACANADKHGDTGNRGRSSVPTPTSTETVTVNTPGEPDTAIVPTNEYNSNYGLGNIKANAAYQRGVYGQGVTVGVVDSGALTSMKNSVLI